MLDWVATQPVVQLDGPRDPRVGMAGGSYGGGIQLIVAADRLPRRRDRPDDRVALARRRASTRPTRPKNGWVGTAHRGDRGPIGRPAHHARRTRRAPRPASSSPDDQAWFASRGPGDLVKHIKIPTLIVQGTADNLFTLDEGITNYGSCATADVPTAMLWFCGGHGVCLTNPGDPTRVGTETMAWLNRYVKRDTTRVRPARASSSSTRTARATPPTTIPLPTGTPITATGAGTLQLVADGGSGPAHPAAGSKDPLAGIASARSRPRRRRTRSTSTSTSTRRRSSSARRS